MDVTLAEYMNAAIERQRLRSDRGLARAIDVEQAIVSRWRTGKALPTEPQMVKLAQLAEADEDRATLLLGLWRATEEPVRDTYRRLLRRCATGSGIAIAIAASLALGPSPAEAAPNSLVSLIVAAANVYYGN
jgi:transcriptional regulator with XRE-family HTH domain